MGVLTFEGKQIREPDERLLQSARVVGGQLGQFLRGKQAGESLRESEARFRSLTQMSTDFFWETDAEHRVASVQHGPGYVPTEPRVLGKTRWEIASVSPTVVPTVIVFCRMAGTTLDRKRSSISMRLLRKTLGNTR